MNNIQKILILGVGGNVSQGIIQVIRNSKWTNNIIILGACVDDNNIGQYMVDRFYISPYANEKDFPTWLKDLCIKEEIDMVISGVEEVIYSISKNLNFLKSGINTKFIVPTIDQLNIGNDKYLTCSWLKQHGFNYPKYANPNNKEELEEFLSLVNFPIIAKLRKGKGSNGLLILNKLEDLDLLENSNKYVLQEYLGDNNSEYTVASYINKNGTFEDLIILKRKLLNGMTIFAESVNNEAIYNQCKLITQELCVYGPLNIQLRMHNNIPVCFEMNVRFSGTTPMRNLLGYMDLQAFIDEYLYENTNLSEYFNVKTGRVYRCFNEVLLEGN